MKLFRGTDSEVAHLDDRLDPGSLGPTLGHDQGPDGLDRTVLGLACPRGPTRQCSSSRFDGVERIGLAVIASGLAVGTVDLDDVDTFAAQDAGQTHPIGAGALYADLGHLSEALEPAQQRFVPSRIRPEGLDPMRRPSGSSAAATWVSRWVSTPPVIPRAGFYHCHGHPFFLTVEGGTAVADRSDGRSGLLVANLTNHPNFGDGACRVNVHLEEPGRRRHKRRLRTPSQTESSSTPEAIQDQQSSGGPFRTLSLFGDMRRSVAPRARRLGGARGHAPSICIVTVWSQKSHWPEVTLGTS